MSLRAGRISFPERAASPRALEEPGGDIPAEQPTHGL
jgi:hypothetical protein